MKVFAPFVVLVSLVPIIMALTINTPMGVVQCQPLQFTWVAGTPPYYLSLLPAGQPAAPAIKSFPIQTGTEYTWIVDLSSGYPFTVAIKDSTGLPAYSDIVTVGPGSDSSCLNANITETAGSATGPVATGATSSSSSTAASSTATTKKNAASQGSISAFGLAGLFGLIGAALF